MINNEYLKTANDFALKVSKAKINSGFQLADIYDFYNMRNEPIYSKYRLENKTTGEKIIRSICKIGGEFECREPDFNNVYPEGCGKKPLYHLPEILAQPDEVVVVVEGEKKCAKLAELGVLSTTSGSATSANGIDWSPLTGRTVRIWRDNDDAGLKYQNSVINILQKINCNVSCVDVEQLHLPEKTDVVDWLKARNDASLTTTKSDILALEHIPLVEVSSGVVTKVANDNVKTYTVFNNTFQLISSGETRGVYFVSHDGSLTWLSSPIEIVAETSDKDSSSWGKLLEWIDPRNIKHSWSMPMKLLAEYGADIRRELLDQGVSLNDTRFAREKFMAYLQVNVDKHALCVNRTGWFENSYVLPNAVYGNSDQLIVFQNTSNFEPAFSQSGTLDEWKQHIAMPSSGNSRLAFSLSLAFAGAMLDLVGEESGGFHLRGSSSIGKSTALELASSVFGKPSTYKRQWRATSNGLEGVAVQYNDGLLVLDEISQCNPKDIGNAIYMLSNQQGKIRANQNGSAKKSASWRLIVLSSGEESLASIMNQCGDKPKAGQENRLADIPADAGKSLGMFEYLHDVQNANEFANQLKKASEKYYGTAGIAWLEYLANDRISITKQAHDYIDHFMASYVPKQSDGLIQRVAKRFALVAATGELATNAGLTGWDSGEATQAAARCFDDWMVNVGGIGNFEERMVLKQIRSFIQANETSRFQRYIVSSSDNPLCVDSKTHNRIGYLKIYTDESKEYQIHPEQFRNEVCKGLDHKLVIRILKKNGWLMCNSDKDASKTVRIPNLKTSTRMYVLNELLWSWDEETGSHDDAFELIKKLEPWVKPSVKRQLQV